MMPGPRAHGRRRLIVGTAGVALGAVLPRVARASVSISPGAPRCFLPAGRHLVDVTLPARAFASLGVFGAPAALLGCSFVGSPLAERLAAHAPLDEDGLLPRLVSLLTDDAPDVLTWVIDVADPVEVALVFAPRDDVKPRRVVDVERHLEAARPLVGLPTPTSPRDGYVLAVPGRYLFARSDVIDALLVAFSETRRRFRADPIAVSDASQWDGRRPKSDRGEPRHISHEGGLDVDLAFPASDGIPSTIRDHCRGVLLEPDRYGCAPGTARGVDYERLAFLLGTLVDLEPGRIVKIFLDDAYRREVVRVTPALHARRLLDDAALAALSEDGVLVASPWHTDHVHVRFAGERARAAF